MTTGHERTGTPSQPNLQELFARYLQRHAAARADGLAPADTTGEVIPHEAVSAQPVDPRVAWQDALGVLCFYQPDAGKGSLPAPPDWPALTASPEPVVALPFCAGNFPQLVRNLQPLLQASDVTALRPSAGRPAPVSALLDWAAQIIQKRQYPQALLALGALRLARQFDRAAELVQQARAQAPVEWQAAWANEEAALAWHRGQAEQARKLWQTQPASAPVLFNRGMAALFADKLTEARSNLQKATEQIPEDSSWHHLGRLYLALAEMRS